MTPVEGSKEMRAYTFLATLIATVPFLALETSSQFADPSVVLDTTWGTFNIRNSGSQLTQASTVNTIVIPGADGFGHTDSIIPNRYDCKHYRVTFSIDDPVFPLAVNMTIELQRGLYVSRNSKPSCQVSWGDTQATNVRMDGITTYTLHTYLQVGIYFISLRCASHFGDENCPNSMSDCVTTSDFLDDFYTSFSTPMKFLAHEAILVSIN
ncbi:uncharacterized protein LOC128246226 [Mya arenaria]|uniref:uncharacterized protein LOC128246226 n=1 Tax=Mya arenaria TaxID=6604 RepID=UPI0022DF57B4|nr:uncharacterized protein LOC128246226 [Mya arenaria]